MTFEEFIGDRIDTMSSQEYADVHYAWEAGIQEGIERMQKAYQIRLRGKSMFAYLPDDYVLVPVEPTEKIIDAFWKVVEEDKEARISNVYRAMIQAAQDEE